MPTTKTRQKAVVVILVTTVVASCAAPNPNSARRNGWNPRLTRESAVVSQGMTVPPSILPETYLSAAQLFESQGMYRKAVIQYRKAIAVNHSCVEAYHRLGLLLSRFGEHHEATSLLERAVVLRPEDSVLRNNLGFEYLLNKRWTEAVREFTRATDLDPDFARAFVNRGIAQSRLGDFDSVLESFRAVLPEPDAYYNLALMYRGQHRYEEASEALERVVSLDPQFTAAWKQLSQIETRLKPNSEPEEPAVVVAAFEEETETSIVTTEVETEFPQITETESAAGDEDELISWIEELLAPDDVQEERPVECGMEEPSREPIGRGSGASDAPGYSYGTQMGTALGVLTADEIEQGRFDLDVLFSLLEADSECDENGSDEVDSVGLRESPGIDPGYEGMVPASELAEDFLLPFITDAEESIIAASLEFDDEPVLPVESPVWFNAGVQETDEAQSASAPLITLGDQGANADTPTTTDEIMESLADVASPVQSAWADTADSASSPADVIEADYGACMADAATVAYTLSLASLGDEECDEFLLDEELLFPLVGRRDLRPPRASETIKVSRRRRTTVEQLDEGNRSFGADASVILAVIKSLETPASPLGSTAEPEFSSPADPVREGTHAPTASVDAWATLRELRARLMMVRNEIRCLERFDAEPAAAVVASAVQTKAALAPAASVDETAVSSYRYTVLSIAVHDTSRLDTAAEESTESMIASVPPRMPMQLASASIDAFALLRELEAELMIVRNDIRCLDTIAEEAARTVLAAIPSSAPVTASTLSIDAWAVSQLQGGDLEILQNEIRCLESQEEATTWAFAASAFDRGTAVGAVENVAPLRALPVRAKRPNEELIRPPMPGRGARVHTSPEVAPATVRTVRFAATGLVNTNDDVFAGIRTIGRIPRGESPKAMLVKLPATERLSKHQSPRRPRDEGRLQDLLSIVMNEMTCIEEREWMSTAIADGDAAHVHGLGAPWPLFDIDNDLQVPGLGTPAIIDPFDPLVIERE